MGGTNKSNNLITLTPREHYFAHLILAKAYPNNTKLKNALSAMAFGGKRRLNSNQYQLIKTIIIKKIPQKLILEEMYFSKKMSFKKIAINFNVSDMTVCKWFRILNIKPKNTTDYKYNMPSRIELQNLLKNKTSKEISKMYNVSISLVYKWLKSYDISPVRVIGIEKSIPSKEILINLYFKRGLNKRQTRGELNNISSELLDKWFKKYNLSFRSSGRRKNFKNNSFLKNS